MHDGSDDPVSELDDGVMIALQVVPRASKSRVLGRHGDRVKIQLAAPPVDGAANAALIDLLAEVLACPRGAVEIVAGETGKRKRVRVRGVVAQVVRRSMGLLPAAALAVIAATLPACAPFTSDLEVDVVLPEDHDDLEAADNASLLLGPDGTVETIAADGVDFSFRVELEPDDVVHELSLYLAEGESLLAWGRTPPFTYGGAGGGLGLFLGRPGALSTFPLALDLPDDHLLAANAVGRGVVLLSSDGATSFIDAFTREAAAAASLDDAPDPRDGTLVGDALGGVMRVRWQQGLGLQRFDPGEDSWRALALQGADEVGARPHASWVVDGGGTVLSLLGGGGHTDVIAVDLVPRDDGTVHAEPIAGLALDVPRDGARAQWIVRADGDDGDDILVFGHGEVSGDGVAAAWWLRGELASGPLDTELRQGGSCTQLDDGSDGQSVRVLCGGGLLGATPTADVEQFDRAADGSVTWTHHADLLQPTMASPLWWADEVAVYAQGEGVLVSFALDTLVAAPSTPALRASGGQAVRDDTGAIIVVGGQDIAGTAVSRLQVFVPALPP
ncbi:MAG: YggU family protein [Nannocystaceae bacterium]|nr:YggU family protein [Nannocystaceae bacterium]